MKTTVNSKHCKIWGKVRKIIKIKVTQNITFLEVGRLVEIPFIKPTFTKIITIQNPNENLVDTQIKTKRIDKPNK